MLQKRNFVLVVALGVGLAAAACSSEPPASGTHADNVTKKNDADAGTAGAAGNAGGTGSDALPTGFTSLHPNGDAKSYYTGFDGTNEYVIPIAFFSDVPPTVTFGDPSVAELQGAPLSLSSSIDPGLQPELEGKIQVLFIKGKKAGETTIHAVAGSIDQTAKLTVNGYGPNDVAVGDHRYNQGTPSCVSCHATLGVHNTSMLADLSDETILGIAVGGNDLLQINVETGQTETVKPNGGDHKWQVTTEERSGLMAYLRSRNLTFQLPASVGK